MQQLSYKAIGHCIRIGAGIGSNRNRRLPLYFSNRGNSRLNAGRIGYTFQRVAAVRIIGFAVTMLPIVSYPFDDFRLYLQRMDQKIFFDIIGASGTRNIVDIEVSDGSSNDLHIFIVNRIMHQPQIKVSHYYHLRVPV